MDADNIETYTVQMTFRDGSTKSLIVKRRLAQDFDLEEKMF